VRDVRADRRLHFVRALLIPHSFPEPDHNDSSSTALVRGGVATAAADTEDRDAGRAVGDRDGAVPAGVLNGEVARLSADRAALLRRLRALGTRINDQVCGAVMRGDGRMRSRASWCH
jgi:hypothetical protein